MYNDASSKNILSDRGFFWPAELRVPERQFAPEEGVHGTITINSTGEVSLELDRMLDSKSPRIFSRESTISPRNVAGRLKSSGKIVLLCDAYSVKPTMKSFYFDHENFVCSYCLLSTGSVEALVRLADEISCVDMPFGKYEEWLCVRPIAINRTDDQIVVNYSRPDDVAFDFSDRIATLKHYMNGPWMGDSHDFELQIFQTSRLEYRFKNPVSVKEAVNAHRQFHDLLILLSNQAVELEWLSVSDVSAQRETTVYYQQSHSYKPEFERHRCWLMYSDIEEKFWDIVHNWIIGRQKIDAGMYLYTATRRGLFQYSENRFMTLVSGMEALHRTVKQENATDQKLADRIADIHAAVKESGLLNNKARQWLKSKLKYASEPSLESRLFDLIQELPVIFERSSLKKFARLCADARNDIAHFGKISRAINDEDFNQRFSDLTQALDYLYHARILIEIGVNPIDVSYIFEKHHLSVLVQQSLAAAGLKMVMTRDNIQEDLPL